MIYANILGRLGADPKEITSSKGSNFMTFDMATDSYESGNTVTQWVRVAVFNETLLKQTKVLKKGSQILVQGKLKTEAFVAKDGSPRSSIDLTADNITFVTSGIKQAENKQSENAENDAENLSCGDFPKTNADNVKTQTVNSPVINSAGTDEELPF
jgi:single-strand DNA-binding protein